MKSTTFALGSLLATIAIAQPHRHQHHHEKRVNTPPVVITTEWVEVYETEYVTATVWVSEGEVPATVAPESTVIPSAVPAQFFEPKSPAVVAVPTPSTSSSVYVAPAPEPTTASAPVVEAAAPVAEAPKVETTAAPVVVAPVVESVPTTAPVVAPVVESVVAPVTSSAAEVSAPVDTSATGSSTSQCSGKSDLCGGDLTFYDPVMESWGACGWHNDGLTEKVVALPVGLMGAQSNGNPYCGKYITILHKGKSTVAKVVDKCMGCKGRSIDISRFAFDDLDDQGVGRTTATWYFNE